MCAHVSFSVQDDIIQKRKEKSRSPTPASQERRGDDESFFSARSFESFPHNSEREWK